MGLPEDQEDTIVARVTCYLVDKLAGILVMVSGMDWSSTEEKDVDVSMDFSGGKNCKKCQKSAGNPVYTDQYEAVWEFKLFSMQSLVR